MLKYTDRHEISQIERMFHHSCVTNSAYYEISGKSGSGKTELIKKTVDRICQADSFIVYIDVINDEYISTSFYLSILENVYMPITHRYDTINNISANASFSHFEKKLIKKQRSIQKLLDASVVSLASVPTVGGSLSSFIDKWVQEHTSSIDNLLFKYFKTVTKRARIHLIIDNYQFLPDTIKQSFEIGMNQFDRGITLITINRVEDTFEHRNPFCTSFSKEYIDIDYISYEQFHDLIKKQGIVINEQQKRKLWDVTKGNLKDIDIIINELRLNPNYNIISNKIAIRNLDDIQRSILIIAALFPAGMKEEYVIAFVREILNEHDCGKIENAIIELIKLGYIYINSNSHDSVKPTHETVIRNVRDAIDFQDLALFQSSLSELLEKLAQEIRGRRDCSYILHCWVGLNTTKTLKEKSSYVQELINIKYKENAYYYIDFIAKKIFDVIIYLPEDCVEKILISFQRVSDFNSGLNILNNIRLADTRLYKKLLIYNSKFLIQTYEFEEAINQLHEIPDSSAKLLCELNSLQHLGRDKEAAALLDTKIQDCEKNEDYYIILRNTAHLFKYEIARNNLLEALYYFTEKRNSPFAEATIHNNLSVINIWHRDYAEAENNLEYAISTLEQLNSNEVFEPYCNKSILFLLRQDYLNGYEYAKRALNECPRSLPLDIIMLTNNLTIAEVCLGKMTIEEGLAVLRNLKDNYQIIEDPWYEFQLMYNTKQLARALCENTTPLLQTYERYINQYNDSRTKYYIIEHFQINGYSISFCLGLSPNWRY